VCFVPGGSLRDAGRALNAAHGQVIDFSGQHGHDPATNAPATPAMALRSTAALILLTEGFRAIGHDVAPVLRQFGLDPAHLDPSALVDRELELRVSVAIAERLDDPLAGLRAGIGLGFGTYGPFSLLLLTAPDMLASMRTAVRFQRLSFLFGEVSFEPGRATSAIRLLPVALPPRAYRFRTDLELAGTWKLACDINRVAQVGAMPCAIEMPYARPPEASVYEESFGCRVRWGGSAARLLWPAEALRAGFSTSDPRVHALLRAQCEQQLAVLDAGGRAISERVAAHISAHSGALPAAADTAAALGLSERSLRRHLQAEGSGYRALLDETRLRRAQELLAEPRLPVEAIAQRLGYSETAAFIHAFKRWTGRSPSAYRRLGPVAQAAGRGVA
jgi:AraC-like DNA-binding protein